MLTLSPSQWKHLSDHAWVVIPDFLDAVTAKMVRRDIHELRAAKRFAVAKIGHDGMVQDETAPFRDIRHSETCPWRQSDALPDHEGRTAVMERLEELRQDLEAKTKKDDTAVLLDPDLTELMYAWYPAGGYYRRHRDAEKDTPSSWRQYSVLLYLQPDWEPAHGGVLRIHRDSGGDERPVDELPNFVDVPPKEGTLVLFQSDAVPHEVLSTHAERYAVVGWFLASQPPTQSTSQEETSAPTVTTGSGTFTTIHPDTLEALRNLRENVPRLAQKLQPQPPVDHSGLIWADTTNDWGIVMAGTPPPAPAPPSEPSFPDTDVRYWKRIASFSTEGKLSTLSLGGQRLRQVPDPSVLLQPALLESVVTLDLANTDVKLDTLCEMIQAAPLVQQLYLGGNGLGCDGLNALAPTLSARRWQVLDLRYNDLGPTAPLDALYQTDQLHLEGNPLGDAGAAALVVSECRELYIGQCELGSDGAAALAAQLAGSRLEKLYLEGNRIGNTGADVLRQALLAGGHVLEKLYVDNNGLSKENALALGAAVNSATVIGDAAFYQ